MEIELERVTCPVCGPSQTTVWLDDSRLTSYVRCKTCGTVYASPRLSQNERHTQNDTIWSFSPKILSFEACRRPALRQEAEFIQQYVRGGRLLDVGCSSGDFFEFFPQPGWERFGVELSSSAAAYAAHTYNAQVYAGTLRSENLPNEFFDLVSMIEMFYYIDDPLEEIKEAWRILKPHGILAVEFPGQAYMFFRSRGLIALLMEGRWCRLSSESPYTYYFNPTSLWKLLENGGFKTVAWHVVPSPVRANRFTNFISSAYYRMYSTLAGHSMKMLNWAPKYIFLAQKG
jgi:SAM-dependent methyltransferase